ncbi:zf-C2H2 type zinc finger protein/UBA domain-containing protein [Schizosaccharomyces cryophilus OY26]|uniref:Zf-C2H2 type zinc finger protein/UBA domain-containing protein n=1 Tax=Schizosaccharomyces cryophilus (strain OY26 / ATCC MYA-4695 / CBS 11777 / NBRC 106824 / NRRL Y48691) TaxID=653667 RepID=S9VWA2_SCHCR|nr:zf-C2H2 type zinc finger protein/UBA domain-containing protein [Schizosaccharomyces cryophilus OY26]EPY51903.1 zf-C2H2 type zinc finger protein/UBA domain-containing protein [Schizosaccharomyces cryophilus OY26]
MTLKCSDCGKLLSSIEMAEFHGVKSGHENFEETEEQVRQRSPEEIKAAIEEMRKKAQEKKKQQEALEEEDKKKNFRILQKSNDETAQAMRQLQDQTRLRELQKMRQQKLEDQEQRKKILAEIEADKKRRAATTSSAANSASSTTVPSTKKPSSTSTSAAADTAAPSRAPPSSGRFSIRHQGQVCNLVIPAEQSLRDVAQQVSEKLQVPLPTAFMTTFPRATYGADVFDRPISQLKDIFPSAVLLPHWQ